MASQRTTGNILSIAESPSTLIFPAETEARGTIPLWMKLHCIEYVNSTLARAAAVPSVTGASVPGLNRRKTTIMVPAPSSFKSSTSLPYIAEELLPGSNIYESLFRTLAPQGIQDSIDAAINAGTDALDAILDLSSMVAGSAFQQDVQTDTKELTFKGGNGTYRSFDIRLYMPCLSVKDSIAAGKIIQTLEALSLPTLISALSLRTTHFFHPPLWIFGVGPLDSVKFDRDWSGYPQLCVLTNVDVRKTAFDTESLAALSDGSGLFKPVAYSVSLGFRELEPSVRATSPGGSVSTAIQSRSAGILSVGTNIIASITDGGA
jgi:hypothetical protein